MASSTSCSRCGTALLRAGSAAEASSPSKPHPRPLSHRPPAARERGDPAFGLFVGCAARTVNVVWCAQRTLRAAQVVERPPSPAVRERGGPGSAFSWGALRAPPTSFGAHSAPYRQLRLWSAPPLPV